MSAHRNNLALQQLLDIMDRLRDPEAGCPWDLQQSFSSIAPYTLEETYEVLDAIESQDYIQLASELGDLLFQVVFYARLGQEQGLFEFADIAEQIGQKLLRRHPHVFPDGTLETTEGSGELEASQVEHQWEAIKAAERQDKQADTSILADIPGALTALMRAAKLQKRAARVGMDWENVGQVRTKLLEELAELDQAGSSGSSSAVEEELGDLLFTVVNFSRHLGVDAETALRKANRKFENRIRLMESIVLEDGKMMETLESAELDTYWEKVKMSLSKS